MDKVAGIVVLYNPGIEVLDNIDSYIHQIDHLYIFDNSTNINNDIPGWFSNHKDCTYFSQNKNMGIAYGFNFGASKALENGYEYLITLDQDSKATPGMVEKLLNALQVDSELVIASPFQTDKFNTQTPGIEKYERIMYAMSSGNLINLEKFKLLGEFKNEYFIDFVDIEYGLRINKNNLKIVRVNEAVLNHKEGDRSKINILGYTFYPANNNPVRMYYKIRNFFYLRDEYNRIYPEFIKKEKIHLIKILILIILFENNKKQKLTLAFKGYLNYRKHIKGIIK